MIAIARAEPGTSRRAQLRAVAVREARLRDIWLDILQGWNRVLTIDLLRHLGRGGAGVNVEAIVGQLELEARRREDRLVQALTLAPIQRDELEEFLTPLGPVTTETLARHQVGGRVVELTQAARANLREQLVVLMREGPTDDVLAGIAASTGLTRRQTIAVQNFRRRLLEQGASRTSAGRQAERYAQRVLRRRARLIARTEAVDFTAEIVEARGLQVGNMTAQWVSARDGNVEEICLSLDNGQRVPVGQPFQSVAGPIRRPTAHPGCRCVLELSRQKPKRVPRRTRRPRVRRPRPPPAPSPRPPPAPPAGEARTAVQVGAELEKVGLKAERVRSRLEARAETLVGRFERKQVRRRQIVERKAAFRREHGIGPFAPVPDELFNSPRWQRLHRLAIRVDRDLDGLADQLDRGTTRLVNVNRRKRAILRKIVARPKAEQNLGDFPNRARDVYRRAKRQTGVEAFQELVSKRWLEEVTVPIRSTSSQRSYYSAGKAWISPDGVSDVVVHELGHAMEAFHADILRASLAFHDRRTAGEAIQRLQSLFPGRRYKFHEVTRKDAFIDAYVGKDYRRTATEIVSMGLEYMARDPLAFFQKDPDHFAYIWDIMRGIIP